MVADVEEFDAGAASDFPASEGRGNDFRLLRELCVKDEESLTQRPKYRTKDYKV